MKVGILQLHLLFHGCTSLKDKRGRLKPLLSRLHKEFNVSVAELDLQDTWQDSIIGCALISNDSRVIHQTFGKIVSFTRSFYTEIDLVDEKIEII